MKKIENGVIKGYQVVELESKEVYSFYTMEWKNPIKECKQDIKMLKKYNKHNSKKTRFEYEPVHDINLKPSEKEIVKIKYLGNGVYEKTFNDKTKERHFDANLKRQSPRMVKKVFKNINKTLYVYGMEKTLKIMEKQGL